MADYLPEEVILEILSRLPVKALIQYRCVCKKWNSLISSPAFISLHLDKSLNPTNGCKNEAVLFRYFIEGTIDNGRERYFLTPVNGSVEELDCPFRCDRYACIVGSHNGVICLADDVSCYTHRAALWNPSVRKMDAIPVNNVTSRTHGAFMHSLGFGFDSENNDYKLVRIVTLGCTSFDWTPLVEVYTLKSGCWKMIPCGIQFVISERSPSAFVNGACHWVADVKREDGLERASIVTFSIGDELFGEMEAPNCLVRGNSTEASAGVLNGSLSLVPFNRHWGERFCDVWVMKEYGNVASWTKLFSIENSQYFLRFVWFTKEGQLLFASKDGISGVLVCYNPETREEGTIVQGEVNSFCVEAVVQSLVLLDK